MFKNITFSFVIASCLMHLFCCGIPLTLSMLSLAGLAGITGSEMAHTGWFAEMEIELLIISGGLLAITAIAQFISNRINCLTDGACAHEPCDDKKVLSKTIFKIAVVVYVVNLIIFLSTHHH